MVGRISFTVVTEFQIDIFVIGIIFVFGSGISFLIVDNQIQEMLLAFTMGTLVLEFDSQILLIFTNPHISSVYFIIPDLFFCIFFIVHGDDLFC